MANEGSVLVTGGAGYIGSHTCVELLEAGYRVIVVDNLSNSKIRVLERITQITGKRIPFFKADILDQAALAQIFKTFSIDVVIHFAGLKAVGESCRQPWRYYHNNVMGTLRLCEVMDQCRIKKLVFSSSATVYGDPHTVPITEDFPLAATNPYGRSKLMIEEMLRDFHRADQLKNTQKAWGIVLLRYFNPVGAHQSGKIGEDPNGIPNNLMPYVSQVAVGKLEKLLVFGADYPTRDGTGVRDYIHVVDLAKGHVKAVEKLLGNPCQGGVFTYNLGTGKGYSVLEVLKAFEKASARKIPYQIVGRRPGDIAECFADPTLAKKELGWTAEKTLADMTADAWRWQFNNPAGYDLG